jgi:diadenosine tetraphosphatase ApaH/serine/threonine PP2A family protein phosphatase
VPAYKELYPVGTEVRVVPRERLEDFRRTWRYHHALQEEQLQYAGSAAQIATVGFYHGGDVLYTLANIPGIWHEVCLDSASTPNAV